MADQFIAEVRAMPYGFVPSGWEACKGQLLPLAQNTALFSLIGTTYGGDGRSTFALPNIPPLEAKSGTLHYCIAVQGMYPPRG